jgi:type I restriction enzyme R subunit
MDQPAFAAAVKLFSGDVRAVIDTSAIDAKDRWRELEALADPERNQHFAASTKADLLSIAAPLQRLRTIRGDEDAYRFDLLMTRLQVELLRGGKDAPAWKRRWSSSPRTRTR